MAEIAGLIISAVAAAASAGIGAYNKKKARDEENAMYKQSRDFLTSQYYRDPLSTIGNRTLIKSAKQAYKDNLDAIDNRMVAGGATMENQLAARQANNEGLDRFYGQLLRGEDARRDSVNQQRQQLEQDHSLNVQQNYLQNAQNWQAWGAQAAQSGMSFGQTALLNRKTDEELVGGYMKT